VRAALTTNALQFWPNGVTEMPWRFARDVVREVRAVPYRNDAIIDVGSMAAKDPYVVARGRRIGFRRRHGVARIGNSIVRLAGRLVLDSSADL
jgi:hypothetical protein